MRREEDISSLHFLARSITGNHSVMPVAPAGCSSCSTVHGLYNLSHKILINQLKPAGFGPAELRAGAVRPQPL